MEISCLLSSQSLRQSRPKRFRDEAIQIFLIENLIKITQKHCERLAHASPIMDTTLIPKFGAKKTHFWSELRIENL
jgi:hypothetical protein